jgi:predicted nucleotidyltransferase
MITRYRINVPMQELVDLCHRYHVRELALFGSVLRDDFRDDSDIDVLVEFEPGALIGLYEHFDLREHLERLLGRKVDLVSKRGLNPMIRDEVITSAQVLYAA